jgi:hypothetical protein
MVAGATPAEGPGQAWLKARPLLWSFLFSLLISLSALGLAPARRSRAWITRRGQRRVHAKAASRIAASRIAASRTALSRKERKGGVAEKESLLRALPKPGSQVLSSPKLKKGKSQFLQ